MTKSELIAILASRYPQLAVRDTDIAVKTVLDAMTQALANGQRIEIRGFGSFSLSERSPRVGRNPKSGEKVMVPGKRVPHFKAGKELRERVDAAFDEEVKAANEADFVSLQADSRIMHG
ncbi:integration host factor subunit beta [Eoetvoesiella caeni]|uniref:Integration host factor subunit beta n=1 Tax=Eoetvoesiella caeni TaxID=645616 RepID=A0A366HJX1_9BURK|nr:integration host factor subunit beta [Eoetvoesiella caeni]MCI2807336.1 integration host factor subunit beta [Eoetvoesiella caeni]NYT53269.1 integration host factor subunit beta [Eoetvoesiella caeni]RBP43250.1 integration host factor subunit beta [Eoetvoesiella caeni]